MKNARLLIWILSAVGWAQNTTYVPGQTYQSANPNYPTRNPFYFEGRIDWDLLKIDQPSNTWEFAQRGIHKQDDLGDIAGAIADYRASIAQNSPDNGTCQYVTGPIPASGQLDPAPCMFTVRLRLGRLLMASSSAEALQLFQEVLHIDPLRLGVHALIAKTYEQMSNQAAAADQAGLLQQATAEYQKELVLSPVTELSKQLTGDQANNAHVHWNLAELFRQLNQPVDEMAELGLYLKATQWHSDTYPWRVEIARKRLQEAEARTLRH
ncbi:MAG: hypothetical protein JOZ22_02695 [Acidobacteriia bacterium]|nr:hypothetical protein [Terriglobia bacterium]